MAERKTLAFAQINFSKSLPKTRLETLYVIPNNCQWQFIRTKVNIKSYCHHLFCERPGHSRSPALTQMERWISDNASHASSRGTKENNSNEAPSPRQFMVFVFPPPWKKGDSSTFIPNIYLLFFWNNHFLPSTAAHPPPPPFLNKISIHRSFSGSWINITDVN